MLTPLEYSLFAAGAYLQKRDEVNEVGPRVADGWTFLPAYYRHDEGSGFEATVHQRGNEIVIAFTGTDELQDWLTNGAGVIGLVSPHLQRAAALYASIVATHGGDGGPGGDQDWGQASDRVLARAAQGDDTAGDPGEMMQYGSGVMWTDLISGRDMQPELRLPARQIATVLAAVLFGLPLVGCASGSAWKEEVMMFDGSKAVVERKVILGNALDQELSDVTHGPPVKGNTLRVPLSASTSSATWEAMGLNPQAIGRVRGSWFLSATPMLCGDYDKWGRPVPPYVFFKYSGESWQRITVEQFPPEITSRNLTYAGSYDQRQAARTGFIAVDQARLLNPGLPDYVRNIFRSGTKGFDECRKYLDVRDVTRGK